MGDWYESLPVPVQAHSALDGLGKHFGDQLDCESCRAFLLTSFASDAREPFEHVDLDAYFGTQPSPEPGPRPHLIPEDTGRTVPLSPEHSPVWGVHPDRKGGIWRAVCSCGWRKEGKYARSGMGEVVARRLAETWASKHREDPEADA